MSIPESTARQGVQPKATNHVPIQLTEYNLLKQQIPNDNRIASTAMKNSFSPNRNSHSTIQGHLGAKIAIIGPKTTKRALNLNYNTLSSPPYGSRSAVSPKNNFIKAKRIDLSSATRNHSEDLKDDLYIKLAES